MADLENNQGTVLTWGKWVYRFRSLTPVPLLFLAIWISEPVTSTIIIGIVLVVTGEVIRMLAMFETHNKTSTRGNVAQSSALVTTGIYSRTRNPLYLGALFTGLGYMSITGCVVLVGIFILLFTVQYYLIIRYEENYLRGEFPSDFESFFNTIPRFFPRLSKTDSPITLPDAELLRGSLYRERSTILGNVVVICLITFAPEIRALIG